METIIEETVRPYQKQRYLVDVTSDAHKKAVNLKLSYLEGILYNDIAYIEDNFGKYQFDDGRFLNLTESEYYSTLDSLQKKNLIILSNNTASIKKMSLEDLVNGTDEISMILATMMAKFIADNHLDVNFDPLKRFKNDNN